MTLKKTLPVPVLTDGVPVVVEAVDKTREIPASLAAMEAMMAEAAPEAPQEIQAEELTTPVHTSIERSLNFEVLRRQTTEEDEPKR